MIVDDDAKFVIL